jgi:two-component system LytT family response regulator
MPAIIFVTAFDRYAVQAFEVHALDYLLKSFDRERFQDALQRAKEQIRHSREGLWNDRLTGLLEDLQARQKRLTRLVIKSGGRIVFLRVDEIDWLEAAVIAFLQGGSPFTEKVSNPTLPRVGSRTAP